MNIDKHKVAILSAIHSARAEQGLPEATPAEDEAAMQAIHAVAQSLRWPDKATEVRRRKLLADLSKALLKAEAVLKEVRECKDAMEVLLEEKNEANRQFDLPADDDKTLASDLTHLANGLRAYVEISGNATGLYLPQIKTGHLIEAFTPAWKQYTGTVPSRNWDHEFDKDYGPYLDYICAIAAALEIETSPAGVAKAMKRMDEEGKDWLRTPYQTSAERFGPYLATLEQAKKP